MVNSTLDLRNSLLKIITDCKKGCRSVRLTMNGLGRNEGAQRTGSWYQYKLSR